MNKRSKFNEEAFRNKAIELFNSGMKSKDIAYQLGISKTALIRNLNLLGYNFDRSTSMQRYPLNRDYFQYIDSNEKAYWLGLIYADGSNKVSKNTFVLGLKKEDSYILDILKNDLETTIPIKIQKDNRNVREDFHRLEIYNKQFCLHLLDKGVFQNKTSILKEPSIITEFVFSFIRGYFDGDGSIYTNNSQENRFKDVITFTGTKEITDYISKFIKKELGINSSVHERHPERDNNNYTISINGRLNVMKLCEKMYENKSNTYLLRKYERYLKIKNRYE